MSLILELSPEVEIRLEAAAEKNSIAPMQYARKLIEDALPAPANRAGISADERARAFREWAETRPKTTIVLSDAAMRHESIYGA